MKIFILIRLCTTALTGCFQDEEDFLFRGLFVEFNAVTYALDPSTFSIPLTDGQGQMAAQINLVGAHLDRDATIAFMVDPNSTAVEGQHYTIEERMATIPAGSSFGEAVFTVSDGGIPAGESVRLTLVLEGNERIEPMENYRRQTYIIYGTE